MTPVTDGNDEVIKQILGYSVSVNQKPINAAPNSLRAEWVWEKYPQKKIELGASRLKIYPYYQTDSDILEFLDYPSNRDGCTAQFSTHFQTLSFDTDTGILEVRGDKPPNGRYVFRSWLDKHHATAF